jgi:hypothetical protein
VTSKLNQNFPYTIHILKPCFDVPSNPTTNENSAQNDLQAQNGNPAQNDHSSPTQKCTLTQNGHPPQNGHSSQNGTLTTKATPPKVQHVVFADSRGFYDAISNFLPSPALVSQNSDQSFDIDTWLTSGESLNILFLK